MRVNEGEEILVKRSDDDHENNMWPLFFVQIQHDDLLDVLEEQLDSLQPTAPLSEEELVTCLFCILIWKRFHSTLLQQNIDLLIRINIVSYFL